MDNRTQVNSDEISITEVVSKIKSIYSYLSGKWLIFLIAVIIGGVLGLLYSYFKKPVYKAELTFALQDSGSNGGGLSSALGLASQFGIEIGGGTAGGEFSGDNLLELMKSRLMIRKALLTPVTINGRKQNLVEYYISFNHFREGWEKPSLKAVHFNINDDQSKFSLTQDSLLGVFYKTLLKDNLTVDKKDKKLNIISLKVNSTNELFAKYFTEILAKEVSDFYVQTKVKKGIKNVAVLQKQTDSVRRALNYAITGVASSIDANPNPNPSFQTLRVPSQRKQVDVQANTAILNELVRNLEIAKMSLLQDTPLIQVIDRPILPLDVDKLGKLKGIVFGSLIGFLLALTILGINNLINFFIYS